MSGASVTVVDAAPTPAPVLTATDLAVSFPVHTTLFGRVTRAVRAVDGVTLDVRPGETLAIVGESGCGKSTMAKALADVVATSGGTVRHRGTDLSTLSRSAKRDFHRDVQLVFQDSGSALDPRQDIERIVAEPLRLHHWKGDIRARVAELLTQVGLRTNMARRYPHELSGGERQRVGIARALALDPSVVILDEPVSALDVSVQAGIVNLLAALQAELGVAYVFISHDLSIVRHISHRVAVMYLGRIVEIGESAEVYEAPRHPYTKALLSAVPRTNVGVTRERIVLSGDVPSPMSPPSGCRFRTRCWKAQDVCAIVTPELFEAGLDHSVACHFPEPASSFPELVESPR